MHRENFLSSFNTDIHIQASSNLEKIYFSDLKKLTIIPVTQEVRDVYGYSIEGKGTVVYYPDPSHHTLSRAMNMLSNLYISLYMPYTSEHGINASHVPLKEILREGEKRWEPKKIYLCLAWATWVSFC